MRVFVLFLFVINVLIGVWFYLQPVTDNLPSSSMPENLKSLVLVSEVEVSHESDKLVIASEIVKTEEEVVDNKPEMMCFTLGPFKDEMLLEQARVKLAAEQAMDMSVRKREESQRHRYWVYLSALSSRAKAIEKSKQLGKAKIKDYYIVYSGDKKNAISLGHFKEKKHADHRVDRLKKYGFESKMEVIFRQVDIFWLDFGVEGGKKMADKLVSEYLIDGVTRLDRSCN